MRRRVRADFPHHADEVIASLAGLTYRVFPDEARDSIYIERIQVAALIVAQQDLRRLDDAVRLGLTDWRDLLVGAGLADEGWKELVNAELTTPGPHIWVEHRPRPTD